jgi:predicted HAD superfamily phosphohydrolase YqeG
MRAAGLEAALSYVEELSARTVIFDVEPLVASWDSGQDALERAVALLVLRACQLPEVQVVCFATNSTRRPQAVPGSAGVRVVYLASAGKPMRIAPYRGFPGPGVVVGDQMATDGLLARRLGYAFVQYCPPLDEMPAGPRLLRQLGRLVRPVAFSRPGRTSPQRSRPGSGDDRNGGKKGAGTDYGNIQRFFGGTG